MIEHDAQPLVYLDQNVLSRIQEGEAGHHSVLKAMEVLRKERALLVYSSTHVEECRNSDRPEAFADILESLSAWFMEEPDALADPVNLRSGCARELILTEPNAVDRAARQIMQMHNVLQYSMGWLGALDAEALKEEISRETRNLLEEIERELPIGLNEYLTAAQGELADLIAGMPLEKLREEARVSQDILSKQLPANYAQLDSIPADEVVAYVLNCLERDEGAHFRESYPP